MKTQTIKVIYTYRLYIKAILLCNVITECIGIAKCWGAKCESAKRCSKRCGVAKRGGATFGAQSMMTQSVGR